MSTQQKVAKLITDMIIREFYDSIYDQSIYNVRNDTRLKIWDLLVADHQFKFQLGTQLHLQTSKRKIDK